MSPSESFRLFYSLCTWRNMSAEKQILALRGSMSMYVMLAVLHHVDFWNRSDFLSGLLFLGFLWYCFSPSHLQRQKTTLLWSIKSLKDGMWGMAKWVAQLNERKEGMSFPSSVTISVTLSHIVFLCASACVSAAVYLSCGVLMQMSHSCLLRPDWVHYTHRCTSHTSPTGNVCFLLWFSLCFPLKAQSAMFYSLFGCQNEMLSPHFSESSSTSEGKLSPRQLNHWLELRLVSSEYSVYSNHIMCQWMGYRLEEWCRHCNCGDKVA